jgi:hypothetical protein
MHVLHSGASVICGVTGKLKMMKRGPIAGEWNQFATVRTVSHVDFACGECETNHRQGNSNSKGNEGEEHDRGSPLWCGGTGIPYRRAISRFSSESHSYGSKSRAILANFSRKNSRNVPRNPWCSRISINVTPTCRSRTRNEPPKYRPLRMYRGFGNAMYGAIARSNCAAVENGRCSLEIETVVMMQVILEMTRSTRV